MKDEDNIMMRFSELVDIPQIQILLERHFKITNIPISVLDKDQNRFVAVGLQDICTKFHRVHPVTLERCQQSDAIIKSLSGSNQQLGKEVHFSLRCRKGRILGDDNG